MAEPESALGVPHTLDDGDEGGLLPPALDDATGIVDADAASEELEPLVGV